MKQLQRTLDILGQKNGKHESTKIGDENRKQEKQTYYQRYLCIKFQISCFDVFVAFFFFLKTFEIRFEKKTKDNKNP